MNSTRETRICILNKITELSKSCKGCEISKELCYGKGSNNYCYSTCNVGKEIKRLGDGLTGVKSKARLILEKGDEMTKSEVAFLISKGINSEIIRKAMGFRFDDYIKIMSGWGFLEKKQVTA